MGWGLVPMGQWAARTRSHNDGKGPHCPPGAQSHSTSAQHSHLSVPGTPLRSSQPQLGWVISLQQEGFQAPALPLTRGAISGRWRRVPSLSFLTRRMGVDGSKPLPGGGPGKQTGWWGRGLAGVCAILAAAACVDGLRALPAQRPAAAGAPPQANPTPCTACPPHSFPGHAHPDAPQPAPRGPTALSPPWGSRIGQPHPCTEPSPQNLVLKSYFPFQEIETPPRIAGTKLGMCGPPQRPSPRGRRLQVCLDPGPSSTEGGKGLSTARGSHGVAGPFGWAAFRAGLCRISRIAGWREGHQGRA